jgi:hypothetical protein
LFISNRPLFSNIFGFFRHTEPNSGGAEAGRRAEEGSAPLGTGSAWLPRRRRGKASSSTTSVGDPDPDPLVRGTDPAPDPDPFLFS